MKFWKTKLGKWIIGIFIGGTVFSGVTFGLQEVPLARVSVIHPLFDTTSGWIEPGQYAINEHGNYYLCLEGDTCGTNIPLREEVEFDVTRLEEVEIIGSQYVNYYFDGELVHESQPITAELYNAYILPKDDPNHLDAPEVSITKFEAGLNELEADTIVTDATTINGNVSNTTGYSFNHTTGTLTNGMIEVKVAMNDTSATDRVVTSISYNSVALAGVAGAKSSNSTANKATEIWFLVAPSSGTNSVTVAFDGTVSTTRLMAVTLSGVAQTGTEDDSGHSEATDATSSSIDLTTTVTDSFLSDVFFRAVQTNTTAGANQVQQDGAAGGGLQYGSSYNATTTAGANTMRWDCNVDCSTADWAHSAVAWKPFVAPAAGGEVPSALIWFE